LCLAPDLRGSGFGKKLIDQFTETVSEMGCKIVMLVTKPHNKISINFYHKMGFKSHPSDRTFEYEGLNVHKNYDGPNQNKIIFIKQLRNFS